MYLQFVPILLSLWLPDWGFRPKLNLTGGRPCQKYPTYILPIYVPCQPLGFLYPLMSLDGNLFQLLPRPSSSEVDYSLRVSGSPVPLYYPKIPLFSSSPNSYRPSATGFQASVWYLHHAMQSRSGIVLLLSVTGQHLGFLCFVLAYLNS